MNVWGNNIYLILRQCKLNLEMIKNVSYFLPTWASIVCLPSEIPGLN